MKLFQSALWHEPKTSIGWAHGIISFLGAVILPYTMGMTATIFLGGDVVERLMPPMLFYPIGVCFLAFYLLLSRTLFHSVMKLLFLTCLNGGLYMYGWMV